MKKNNKFFIGLSGVAIVITYLIWTGVSETMLYYFTPIELLARVKEDPTFHKVGIKVSGRIVPGSWEHADERNPNRFRIVDLEDDNASFSVEYDDALPDTFNDRENVDAVVEGRFREDGIFEATLVLTKCGSRYEATPEELAG